MRNTIVAFAGMTVCAALAQDLSALPEYQPSKRISGVIRKQEPKIVSHLSTPSGPATNVRKSGNLSSLNEYTASQFLRFTSVQMQEFQMWRSTKR